MAISLLLSVTIALLITFPLSFIASQKKEITSITLILFGSLFASIVYVVHLSSLWLVKLIDNSFLLVENYSINSITHTQQNFRTILFWYLVIFAIFNEFIRNFGLEYKLNKISLPNSLAFGLGWGIIDVFVRVIFLDNILLGTKLILIIYFILTNITLSVLMTRVEENTKFVMFAAMIKFFTDLAYFGGIGYQSDVFQLELIIVVIIVVILGILSVITKIYPLIEDTIEISS